MSDNAILINKSGISDIEEELYTSEEKIHIVENFMDLLTLLSSNMTDDSLCLDLFHPIMNHISEMAADSRIAVEKSADKLRKISTYGNN